MRTRTLLSLLILTGSSAAVANMAVPQQEPMMTNEAANETVPAPDNTMSNDTMGNDTMSNATDVEPSAEPTEPADNSSETPPPPE